MFTINERETSRPVEDVVIRVFPVIHSPSPFFDSDLPPSNTVKFRTDSLVELSEAKQFVRDKLGKFALKQDKLVPKNWNTFQHYKLEVEDPDERDPEYPVAGDRTRYITGTLWNGFDQFQGYVLVPFDKFCFSERFGRFGEPIKDLPDFKTVLSPHDLVGGPANLDELITASLRRMCPLIQANVSLVNFILELKDLFTLKTFLKEVKHIALGALSSALHIASKFPEFVRNHRGVRVAFEKLSFRDVVRLGAEAHLELNFNVLPFISDVAAIWRSLKTFLSDAKSKVNAESGVKVHHFNFVWNEFPDYEEQYEYTKLLGAQQDPFHIWTYCNVRRKVEYFPTEFKAQLQYNANYTEFQTAHARGLALLDSLGVNLNPQIIWNAIPWSFVVDWVVSVGDYLSQFRKGNLDPDVNILQYSWSVFRERRIKVYSFDRIALADASAEPPDYKLQYISRETAYRRAPGLGQMENLLRVSGLNLKQFTLAAALAITRKRKHHKHG